jgi:hypothetical protein
MRLLLLAAALTATAALGGCKSSSTASSGSSAPAAPSSAGGSSAGGSSAGAPATGTARPSSCNPDYCEPADWETARAATPLAQIPPFVEPLNVVIGARSTVSLTAIQQALSDWKTVSTATDVTVAGIHLKCISSESADVTGNGYRPQYTAWRLGGCLGGNELSVSGNEDHVRIWNQPVPGSRYGAWFIAASYETMCLVRDGKLQTADANKGYAVLHPGDVYHCVDGGPGSVTTAHKDGYDAAAAAFSAAVAAAAKAHGWHVSERTASAARGASAVEGGVPFNAAVYVVTVTA